MSRSTIPPGVFVLHGLALAAFGGLALAASSPELEAVQLDELRAWRLPPAEAEAATAHHRLIGLACGPDRLTMTAEEEDHFPAPCYAVDTPAAMCPADEGDLPTVAECAAYLGDGW